MAYFDTPIVTFVNPYMSEYRIARNVSGGKHWRISLKTALAKNILANAFLTSNEMLLAKMVVIINMFVM